MFLVIMLSGVAKLGNIIAIFGHFAKAIVRKNGYKIFDYDQPSLARP